VSRAAWVRSSSSARSRTCSPTAEPSPGSAGGRVRTVCTAAARPPTGRVEHMF
jgi:hypothetical protein